MGRRMLYSWLLNPLLDAQDIQKRLDIVDYFFNNYQVLIDVRELLSEINDLERIVGKIGLNRANARDFRAMFNSLLKAEKLSAFNRIQ
jgi:DNA mismatch repair protein MutS